MDEIQRSHWRVRFQGEGMGSIPSKMELKGILHIPKLRVSDCYRL
jgi:hypothetical protein